MAGSKPKYRHLSRSSAHRQALLRNLVDQLFEREHISTTWHKAKEAQRLAERLITMAKENTPESRRQAESYLYRPKHILPKLFDTFAHRYANRLGGYTRVSRIEPAKEDQAPSAILELVDGPFDMKFHLTARAAARNISQNIPLNELDKLNIKKVTQFRDNGAAEFKALVTKFEQMGEFKGELPPKHKVYPDALAPSRMEQRMDRLYKFSKKPWW